MKYSNVLMGLVSLILFSSANAEHNKALEKRYIAKLNQHVSFFGIGTVELGRDWGIDVDESVHPKEVTAKNILRTAMNKGIGVVDTASSYQLSEQRIGKYIPQADYQYLLITKPGEHSVLAKDPLCKKASYDNIYCRTPGGAYDFSYKAIIDDVNASLENLKVKSLNVVLLHLDSHDAQAVLEKGEALQALYDLRAQGKIQYVGVSINGAPALYAVQNLNIDVIELEYNLLNQSNEKTIALAHKKGIGVIVRGGLGTGLLTPAVAAHINDINLPFKKQVEALLALVGYDYDKLTALELAFLYHNPHISTVIIGFDKPALIAKDINLLNHFKDGKLLIHAKELMRKFPASDTFTEIMGEFYADKKAI